MTSSLALIVSMVLIAAVVFFIAAFVFSAHQRAPLKTRASSAQSSFMKRLEKMSSARLAPALRTRLANGIRQAGGKKTTPERLVARALLLGTLGCIWGIVLVSGQLPWYVALSAPVLGFAYPFLQLSDHIKKRRNAILRDLSYHLDLLTLSVEAGLDFGAALGRIVDKGKPGPLREELAMMLSEIRVGTPRSQALRSLSERVSIPQVSSLTSSLIQADKLGVSLGKVLRTQSETVRTERSQRAEKRANEAPVKILIPLVLFVFPTIWIILAAPLVFSWMF